MEPELAEELARLAGSAGSMQHATRMIREYLRSYLARPDVIERAKIAIDRGFDEGGLDGAASAALASITEAKP